MENHKFSNDKIKERIIEAIKQSGLSQTEIAKKLNLSQSTIAHYIKGDIMPSLETFVRLCILIDASPNYILGFD